MVQMQKATNGAEEESDSLATLRTNALTVSSLIPAKISEAEALSPFSSPPSPPSPSSPS